jgi:ligand-binding sensor domain-containing protein/signal transduction histidine kinase
MILLTAMMSVAGSSLFGQAIQSSGRVSVPQARVDSQPVRVPVVEGKGVRFTHLPAAQGLSQVRVAQIIQGPRGFLWFGTQVGVNRYDGYKFKVFTHDLGRPDSLSGNFVYSLFKDRSGAVWVGTDQSLDRLELSTGSFTHFHIDRGDPIVNHISQDSAGMLWLATEIGLYRFDPANGRVSRFGHDPNDPFSLTSDGIQSAGEDRSGKFWVITDAGLDAFDRATGKVALHVPLPEAVHGSLCSIACRSFYEDRRGVFWIIYDSGSGLAVFDRATNRLTRYAFLEQGPSAVVSAGVNALLEDHQGTMWFGTMGGGLLKHDRAHQRFIRYTHHPNDPDSLAENRIIALFEDREGNIWASFHAMAPDFFADTQSRFEQFQQTSLDPKSQGENLVNAIYEDLGGTLWMGAGGSLIGLNRKTGRYTRYNLEGQGVSTEVLAILEDRSGTMWVGTLGNGLSRFDPRTGQFKTYRHQPADPTSLSNDTVTRLFIDHAGTMWVSTWDGLDRFDPGTGRFAVYRRDPNSTEQYFSIMEDQKNCLWLGGRSGLLRFCPETGRFSTFQHESGNLRSLSDNSVTSVYQDRTGAIWAGTQDGLDKLDPETNTFTSYFRKDGVTDLSCILGDDQGNLWMSTNNGLSRFDPLAQSFKTYFVADGLPGNDLTGWDACFKSRSGEMFFGGFAGAVAFRPDTISDTTFIPPVVFTDFQLSSRPVEIGAGSPLRRSITYTDDLTLTHRQATFSVEFSALSFRTPATNRYRYKLESLDSEWHASGSEQRVVNYNALPAGTYVLRVQGATSRGPWSEPGASLRIVILPPWWNTLWFKSVCVVFVFLCIYLAHSYRMRQIALQFEVRLEERVSERTRIARELHDTLLQSFQGLLLRFQSVSDLLLTRPEDAKGRLDSAIDYAAKAITEGRDAVHQLRSASVVTNDLGSAISMLAQELSVDHNEATAPEFSLQVEGTPRNLDPIVRDEVYRIAAEALRNAFKHSGAERIEVELRYGERELRLRTRDDGRGIDPAILAQDRPAGHWGLSGIRERAKLLSAKLEIWSEVDSGTEVELIIPAAVIYTERKAWYQRLASVFKKAA